MRKKITHHLHHIIPKHMGGTDDETNLVLLTIEEHALAHKELYEKYGLVEDKIAWKCLEGKSKEIEEERIQLSLIGIKKRKESGEARKGTYKAWETKRARGYVSPLKGVPNPFISERNKINRKAGKMHCIGDSMRGKPLSEKHKNKLSIIASNRPKIECEHCNKHIVKQMYVRFHGDKCKGKK